MKRILAALFFFCGIHVCHAEASIDANTFVELDRTDTVIELDAAFPNCHGLHHFKVQDGAMNVLSIEGQQPVKFIVKQYAPNDIKLHIVSNKKYVQNGKQTDGLLIQGGVNILSSPLPVEMKSAGVEKLIFKSVSKSSGVRKPIPDAGLATAGSLSCCDFKACGSLNGRFCSSGAGCGGDHCGMCCVSCGGEM